MKTGKKLLTGSLMALCAILLSLCIVLAIGWSKAAKADTALPEVHNNGTAIQWRYSDEADWHDLVALTELRGAAGETGKDGANGENGTDGKNGINGTNGKDGINGVDGKDGADGKNGKDGIDGADGKDGKDGINAKNIEVQRAESYIQWRYEGGEWQNLVALADILGPSGQNGTNGEDGRTPEFRVNGNQLQWRYEGETIWLNLYDLSVLKGADGKDGSCAGYFAANGSVYSAGKALPFTVKKKSGGLISYNASSNKITLSKGHTYSLVFSGTIAVSAKSDGKACGAALFDGYNSEMALETQTYVTAPKADQTEKLTMAYNTIYTAEEDITLTFQYTTMLLQDTNFKDARYNITIIALD